MLEQLFQDDYSEALKKMAEYFKKAYQINDKIRFEVSFVAQFIKNERSS